MKNLISVTSYSTKKMKVFENEKMFVFFQLQTLHMQSKIKTKVETRFCLIFGDLIDFDFPFFLGYIFLRIFPTTIQSERDFLGPVFLLCYFTGQQKINFSYYLPTTSILKKKLDFMESFE